MSAPRTWSGRGVSAARAVVEQWLPAKCGRCSEIVQPTDEWIVGHIKSRAAYPELTWEQSNWQPEHKACSQRSAQEAVQEKAARNAVRADRRASFPLADDPGQSPLGPGRPCTPT